MTKQTISRAALLAAAATLLATVSIGAALADPVTPERLVNAQKDEPQNWLLPYGSYAGFSHSPLKEITKDNVGGLKIKFMTAIGGGQPGSIGAQAPGQAEGVAVGQAAVEDGAVEAAAGQEAPRRRQGIGVVALVPPGFQEFVEVLGDGPVVFDDEDVHGAVRGGRAPL